MQEVYCLSTGIGEEAADDIIRIFPNPVSDFTTISFSLSQSQKLSLKVFDANGKLVATLDDKVDRKGENKIGWNAAGTNEEDYFLQFQSAKHLATVKLMVAK